MGKGHGELNSLWIFASRIKSLIFFFLWMWIERQGSLRSSCTQPPGEQSCHLSCPARMTWQVKKWEQQAVVAGSGHWREMCSHTGHCSLRCPAPAGSATRASPEHHCIHPVFTCVFKGEKTRAKNILMLQLVRGPMSGW